MSRRSRVPYDPGMSREMATFLDRLDKRRLTAIADLEDNADLLDVIGKINAILAEMRERDAMEE